MNPVVDKVCASCGRCLASRWSRIALSAAVVSLAIILLVPYVDWHFPTFRHPWPAVQRDEGTFLYQAHRIAKGHVQYRDFFDFKGIVGYLPFAFLFAAVGPSVVAARLLMIAIVVLIGAVAFSVCRVAAGRVTAPAYLAAAFPALLTWPSWPAAYPELVAQLLFLLALLLGARALRGSTWAVFFSGLFCGLALWTQQAQGVPGTIAFGGALVLIQVGRGAPRAASRWAVIFLGGVVAVSAAILLYFWLEDALVDLYESVVLFPLQRYGSVNQTTYAFDVDMWVKRWSKINSVAGEAVWVMGISLAAVPIAAAGASLGAAWVASKRAFLGLRDRSSQAEPRAGELAILALSLSATVVPVVTSITRSDLCHIGFVAPVAFTGLMVLAASVDDSDLSKWSRLAGRAYVATYALALGVAGLFFLGCVFVLYSPRSILTVDAQMRAHYGCHGDRALLEDGDTAVYLPVGGFHYLLTERDSAISYSILKHRAVYYSGQWERAAVEISKRKPVLMRITSQDFKALKKHVPTLGQMYYGSSGLYALVERRPGPPLAGSTNWHATIQTAAGARTTGSVRLEASDQARLLATLTKRGTEQGPLLGRVDGSTIAVWHGKTSYVGELSADGRTISGKIYVKNRPEAESAQFEWRLLPLKAPVP